LIHRASVAAEFGDPTGVLRVATEIDTESMPAGLQGRRSRLHLDLAWAQTQAKTDMEAVFHLQQAEGVAPESIRYHTIARELVRELLKRSRKPTPSPDQHRNPRRSPRVTNRTLYLVTCGAPLATRVGDGVRAARERGWDPYVIPTDAAMPWLAEQDLEGAPVFRGNLTSRGALLKLTELPWSR
jgi:hypothetical protein